MTRPVSKSLDQKCTSPAKTWWSKVRCRGVEDHLVYFANH